MGKEHRGFGLETFISAIGGERLSWRERRTRAQTAHDKLVSHLRHGFWEEPKNDFTFFGFRGPVKAAPVGSEFRGIWARAYSEVPISELLPFKHRVELHGTFLDEKRRSRKLYTVKRRKITNANGRVLQTREDFEKVEELISLLT